MKNITFKLETLTCPSCVNKIEKALSKTKGVKDVNVFFNSSKVKIVYDEDMVSDQKLATVIQYVGFDVLDSKNL